MSNKVRSVSVTFSINMALWLSIKIYSFFCGEVEVICEDFKAFGSYYPINKDNLFYGIDL